MASKCQHGDHICALYASEPEQLAIAADYIAEGLRRGERCLYAGASPAVLRRFRAALMLAGIDAAGMVKRGALLEFTNAEVHLAGGAFDAERMLRLLNDAVEAALNAGFQGLRTCGDMSWLLGEPAGSEQVVEYEAHLNQFFRGVRAVGMCLFDRTRLPAGLIDHAVATHSSVTFDGRVIANPFFESHDTAASRIPQVDKVAWKLNELRRRHAIAH